MRCAARSRAAADVRRPRCAAASAAASQPGARAVRARGATGTRRRSRPSADLLVLETTDVPPPDTWLRIVVGRGRPRRQGTETPGKRSRRRSSWSRRSSWTGSAARPRATPTPTTRCASAAACPSAQARRALRAVGRDGSGPAAAAHAAKPPAARATRTPGDELTTTSTTTTIARRSTSRTPASAAAGAHLCRRGLAATSPPPTARPSATPGLGTLENWHRRAFAQLRLGPRRVGGGRRRACCRSTRATCSSVTQWLPPLRVDELMPALRAAAGASASPEPGPARARRARCTRGPTCSQSVGLDLQPVLSAERPGPRLGGARGRRAHRARAPGGEPAPSAPASCRSRTSASA